MPDFSGLLVALKKFKKDLKYYNFKSVLLNNVLKPYPFYLPRQFLLIYCINKIL